MSNWKYLNAARVKSGEYASTPEDGFNGAFEITVPGQRLYCVASDGMGWKHVSVTRMNPDGTTSVWTPKWEHMCQVKELFFEPEDWVVQYHPPQSQNISLHPGCLHLWMPLEQSMPKPPRILI